MTAVAGSGTNRLRATVSGLASTDQLVISLFFKRDGGATPGSIQYFCALSNASASPQCSIGYDTEADITASANVSGNTDTSANSIADTWEHYFYVVGPLETNPVVRRFAKDDTEVFTTTTASTSSGNLTQLDVFAGSAGTGLAKGKMHAFAIWKNLPSGLWAPLRTLLQTTAPQVITPAPHYANLLVNENTTPTPDEWAPEVGSGTLLETGTITLDGGDVPSLSTTPVSLLSSRRRMAMVL